MRNTEIPNKNKSLSLFHINACSHNKNYDHLQHLLSCTKNNFDIISVTQTIINNQASLLQNLNLNNYSYEFTAKKTSTGSTIPYIDNHLPYKFCNSLNICKKSKLE